MSRFDPEDGFATIDAMTNAEMIHLWRTAPPGYFQKSDPYTHYMVTRMQERKNADLSAWVSASKQVGF